MTRTVAFRLAALREFEDAAVWYEGRRSGLGESFIAAIDDAMELAAKTPNRFPAMHRNVRCVRVRRFPFSVFFVPEPDRIVVLSIFHASRDPIIWKYRT